MKITEIEIRACSPGSVGDAVDDAQLRGGTAPEVVVISMKTDEGITGVSFGSGGLDARVTARAFAQVRPFFIGRNPMAREQNATEFRWFDRRWNHSPIYAYGPFDIASWDIAGVRAGLPIHELIGTAAERRAVYVSSMFLETPEEYAAQALEVQARGFRGYKVHPPGVLDVDLDVYRAVREAVGPDFTLMSDPVGAYNYGQALRAGRVLEELDYRWLEEPVYDHDWKTQAKLARDLDIPIVGTETLPGAHQSTAQYIAGNVVDIVRTDVSWRGGVSGVIKVASLADAFGMQCELHTCVYHALDLINLHCAVAVSNCEFFELLYPFTDFDFGLKTGITLEDGYAVPPSGPGLGIDYDWNFIDDQTVAVL